MTDKVNFEELMGQEEEPQQPQSPVPPQGQSRRADHDAQLENLKKQRKEVNERLKHAFENNYDGYKVDTDREGNPHFGSKGYAKLEQDKLQRDNLGDQIREFEEFRRQEQTTTQNSLERAKVLVREVFDEEIKYVNKDHKDEVQRIYVDGLKQVNWSDANLRTDMAKRGMLSMIFGWAAQSVRKQKQSSGRAPAGERIDASHEESGEESGEPEKNEYGWDEGSIGHKITQQYEERLQSRQRGTLGRRRDS